MSTGILDLPRLITGGSAPEGPAPSLSLAQATRARLAELTQTHGVDAATTALFQALANDGDQRAFLAELETLAASPARPRFPRDVRLVVVPGAFYREFPRYGSGGEAFLEAALDAGMIAERVPLESLGRLENAVQRIEAFFAESRGATRDVIVTVSMGGLAFRRAVERSPQLFTGTLGWINVAGLLSGSAAADHILASPWQRSLLKSYLRWKGGAAQIVEDLRWQPDVAAFQVPAGMPVVSCVGLPLTKHVAQRRTLAARHRALAAHGPNDGATLLADTIVRPGLVLPLWGADHYFQTFDRVASAVERLLRYASHRWT